MVKAMGRARDLEDLLHVRSEALADLSPSAARAAADTSGGRGRGRNEYCTTHLPVAALVTATVVEWIIALRRHELQIFLQLARPGRRLAVVEPVDLIATRRSESTQLMPTPRLAVSKSARGRVSRATLMWTDTKSLYVVS